MTVATSIQNSPNKENCGLYIPERHSDIPQAAYTILKDIPTFQTQLIHC